MHKSMLLGCLAVALSLVLWGSGMAAEHPGSKVPGKAEHPGSAVEHPGHAVTAGAVKKAMNEHISAQVAAGGGAFVLKDQEMNKTWRLKFVKIHDPVRMFEKDGTKIYFACTDFRSVDSEDLLDIDFWLTEEGHELKVIDTKIHKLNGKPRYQYEGTEPKPIK